MPRWIQTSCNGTLVSPPVATRRLDRLPWADMARTMSLTRDSSVTVSAGHEGHSFRPSSSSYIIRPRRHSETASSLDKPRPKSASNLLSAFESPRKDVCHYQIDDGFLTRSLGRRPRDNDVAALIDFLRNQAPPSNNFMSMSESTDEDRGRWSKIKHMGKRSKSMPRPLKHMRLPDTAISGTTIGGHRHIAISIPLEVSPFSDMPRSQYPVYYKDGSASRDSAPLDAPTLTFMNDKGTVTILRTVAEDREPTTPGSPDTSGMSLPVSSYYRHHRPTGSKASTTTQSRGSLKSRGQESTKTTTSKTPIFDQYRSRGDPLAEEQPGNVSSSKSFQRSLYPARRSSMPGRPASTQPTSIDGLIASSAPASRDGSQLRINTETTDAPTIERPRSSAKEGKIKRLPTPLVFGTQPMGGLIHDRADLSAPLTPALAESPLLPPEHGSAPPSPTGRSRRDVVRDRKRRDIERMRSGKGRKSGEVREPERGAASGQKHTGMQPTLCPIVVVVDVEPSTGSEGSQSEGIASPGTLRPTRSLDSFATALMSPLNEKPSKEAELNVTAKAFQRQQPTDRTSLSRRREWNETREQDRKAREARANARKEAKHLVAAGFPYEHVKALQPDEETLRLYETYRDQRIREMERRVRRLERNGDAWLRALVPVLDMMSRQVMADYEDEEEDELTPTKSRAGSKRKAKFSQNQLLEELARRRGEEKDCAKLGGSARAGG